MKKDNTTLLLGAGALAIIYFGILRPITNALGLTDSEKKRREKEVIAQANKNKGWSPNLYLEPVKNGIPGGVKYLLMSQATTDARSKQIYDAFGLFNDNEESIYAVFRLLKSQVQLSQLCYAYSVKYKQDLLRRLQTPWYYMKDGLDEKEFAIIAGIVNELPLYTKP